jgi:parallel beta-helix repeat protein
MWRRRLRLGLGRHRHRRGPLSSASSRTGIAVLLLLVAPAGASEAADYYVDIASPACSNAGPGTEAQPYCSITAALAAHHVPGVTINVKPGVYREQVTVSASGAAGNPIVLRAIGGSVVLDGSDDFSSPDHWVQTADDEYLAEDVTWEPHQVFKDGERLTPSLAAPGSLPPNTFTWVSGQGLYVNADGDDPGEYELMVGRRNYGFNMSTKSWIRIEGFTIAHVESRGIFLNSGCSDIVVARDTVSFADSYGIQAVNGLRVLIEACRSSDNNFHGIGLTAGATACTLRANESLRNSDPEARRANGIHLFSAPGNVLYGNRAHDNQDSGIHFGDGSNNCLAYNNGSWNNGDHGFDHLNVSGTIHVHNVASGNFKDGFSIEDTSPNSRLHDCIAVNNGLTTNHFNLWVNGPSLVGFVSDFNIFWNSTSQAPIKTGVTIYPTIAAYQAATGQDAHSLQANPLFVNEPGGDFHLLAGSPAIDAGSSSAPGWPPLDADGEARVDDPATANTGAGPVLFPDRGAFEFLTDQAPVVTAPPALTVFETDPISIAVTALDPDGDAIDSLTVSGLPSGATFVADPGDTSGTFQWIPTSGQAGSYTVMFLASGAFTGSDSTVITVRPATVAVGVPTTEPPTRPSVSPNPTRGSARLRFGLALGGAVRVDLFDLSGRIVRTLMDATDARAGVYDLSFDIGSGGEASLPQGLYFYRIQTSAGVAMGRFVVAR